MTLAEFDAAGALARRAADAAPSLRALPGYVGISLAGGKIAVEGSGAELRARVAELNGSGPADFLLAAPAAAAAVPSAAELLASSTQQLFEAYVREVGAAGLQAVTYTDGHFVIRTGGTNTAQSVPAADALPPRSRLRCPVRRDVQPATAPGTVPKMSAADFVARYANVTLEQGSRITTEEDYFGGQGYIVDGPALCSAGFGAFSPAGEPLVLTAGHCAADGSAKQAADRRSGRGAGGRRGRFGRGRRDPGHIRVQPVRRPGQFQVAPDGTNVGTDIAVLQGIRSGLDLQPAVTRWDKPADPGPTSVKIVGTVAPFQGQPVCRSGRTTGWRCGTVDSVGIWAIVGPNSLPPDYDNDLRAVRGFDSTSVTSGGGDSGGPWISGNFAVGLHTGAESTERASRRGPSRPASRTPWARSPAVSSCNCSWPSQRSRRPPTEPSRPVSRLPGTSVPVRPPWWLRIPRSASPSWTRNQARPQARRTASPGSAGRRVGKLAVPRTVVGRALQVLG